MGSTTTKKGAHTLNKSAHIRKRMKRKMLKNVNDKKRIEKKIMDTKNLFQVFKFPDVTTEELLNGRLTTTVYLGRGRWKSDKKIGSFNGN